MLDASPYRNGESGDQKMDSGAREAMLIVPPAISAIKAVLHSHFDVPSDVEDGQQQSTN